MKKLISKLILCYLRFFAKIQLKKIKPIVIGVGGSSGKTSLSSLITIILSGKHKVRFNEGKNSESGIPLNILGLNLKNYSFLSWLKIIFLAPFKVLFDYKKYQFYVSEMGIDSPFEPKNMSYLLKIIQPDVAVLTNISLEHSEYFDELVLETNEEQRREEILKLTAKEELLLLKSLSKDKKAILNIDDLQINKEVENIKANKITVSKRKEKADFYIKESIVKADRFLINFSFNNKDYTLKLNTPLPSYFAKTICLAIATCFSLGIDVKDSIERIEKHFKLPPGRLSIFNGVKNTLIVDSSYNNATLQPFLGILDLITAISQRRRKLVILGDFRELGTASEYIHKKAAEKIIQSADFAILIGPMMQKYVAPILEKKNLPYKSFLTFSDARYFILTNIKKRDLILVKGSQNTLFLERVVEMLLKNPKDKDKLCRRGEYWDKIRQKTA